jgi:hypothetical protein
MKFSKWKTNAIANIAAGASTSAIAILLSGYAVHKLDDINAWLWLAMWQIFSTCQTIAAATSAPLIRYIGSKSDTQHGKICYGQNTIKNLRLTSDFAMLAFSVLAAAGYYYSKSHPSEKIQLLACIAGAALTSLIMTKPLLNQAKFSALSQNPKGVICLLISRFGTYGTVGLTLLGTKSPIWAAAAGIPSALIFNEASKIFAEKNLPETTPSEEKKNEWPNLLQSYCTALFMNAPIIILTAGIFQWLTMKNSVHIKTYAIANIFAVAAVAFVQAMIQPMIANLVRMRRAGDISGGRNLTRTITLRLSLVLLITIGTCWTAYFANSLGWIDTPNKISSTEILCLVVSTHLIRLISLPLSIDLLVNRSPRTQALPSLVEVTTLIAMLTLPLSSAFSDPAYTAAYGSLLSSLVLLATYFALIVKKK